MNECKVTPREWAISRSRYNLYEWPDVPEGTPDPWDVLLSSAEAVDYLGIELHELDLIVNDGGLSVSEEGLYNLEGLELYRWGKRLWR